MILAFPRGARLGLLLFALVTLALTVFFSARFGGPAVRTSDPLAVRTILVDAQGVAVGSDVLVRGVKAGRVARVRATGPRTELTLELRGDAAPLVRRDAVARIGTKTPLGESFVNLDPGRRRSSVVVQDGDLIAAEASVDLDEALEALDPGARRDLQAVLRESGRGLRSEAAGGRIGATVVALDDTVEALDTLTGTLRGQAEDIATTVGSGRTILQALATRDAGIRALVSDARRTLAAAGEDPAALRATLRELPALTRQVRLTLADADALVTDARGPVADLRRAAGPLTAALQAAPVPLDALDRVLTRAPAVRAAALPALASLRRTLPVVGEAAGLLGPALANVVPMLDYLAPRSATIAAWFTNTDDLGRNGDAKGRWARFFIGFDPNTGFAVPGGPRQNAYTQPGDARANKAFRAGDFPQLQPFRDALAGTGPVRP